MKKYIIFAILIVSNTFVFAANKKNGDPIKAEDFNSSVFNIGSIQHALLTESEFQKLNGDCWVMMNGQSIVDSDYAILTGRIVLPNASGRFLRNSGGNAVALGNTQEDELKSHSHLAQVPTVSYNLSSSPLTLAATNSSNKGASISSLNSTGGLETRPVNITVNMFIKINKQCNFD